MIKKCLSDGTSIYSHENFFIKEFMNLDSSKSYVIKSEKDDLTNEIFKEYILEKITKLLHFQDRAAVPIVWSQSSIFRSCIMG